MVSSRTIAFVITVIACLWIASRFIVPGEEITDGSVQAEVADKEDAIPAIRVRTSTAENFTRQVLLTGRTQASRRVNLRAEITGRVTEILREEGAVVQAGDVLARIELQDRDARVREAQSLVAQREIQFEAAKALESKGFNSRVALAQAEAQLETARAVLEDARSTRGKTDITAPFDGILNEQNIELGDTLSAGNDLFTVVQINPLEIEAFVAEKDIAAIRPGKPVTAEFLDGDTTLQGTITFSAAAANPMTRTFRILASADNPDNSLRAGLTVRLSVPAEELSAHKISSSNLTLNDEGMIGVKIVDGSDIVQFKPVRILADFSGETWVDGLPDETRIITVGQEFVKTGQRVNAVESDGGGLL
ncbi:MAG: efflux RND transporter periplasmic adaptor subunit [Alphaproteobacteria bacterium]|nr:efflux RND transporter periplasmic adaptor subunit [Alphaproteobacteria bacterium]MCD8526197.1 efflux RND transporter periplasmic adaptor subunit [Alphaproteobacteria bacterium]MCD8570151.1 efflux RND transporter periplasmic adaptor subunit [Alphaproteobacteria bacterium]